MPPAPILICPGLLPEAVTLQRGPFDPAVPVPPPPLPAAAAQPQLPQLLPGHRQARSLPGPDLPKSTGDANNLIRLDLFKVWVQLVWLIRFV